MPANYYEFRTLRQVGAPREVLYEILRQGRDYPRWWPEVYLDARYTRSGRADHVGDRTAASPSVAGSETAFSLESSLGDVDQTAEAQGRGGKATLP